MTYGELKNFNYKELENFAYGELELSSDEILEIIRDDNRPLPISVIDKLDMLNTVLPDNISKQKCKLKSFKEVFDFLNAVVNFVKNSIEIHNKLLPYLNALFEEIYKYIK